MNIFLFNKSLRCNDNTTLIHQMKTEKNVIPFFIFTEQVNQNKNKYFSNNSVQFMCESLHELSNEIKIKYKRKLYFFHSDNLIKVFEEIIKNNKINSIASNYDYSPYAKLRQDILQKFCDKNNIIFYIKEDHVLYNILDGLTLKKDNTPYTVYTPFKNHCLEKLKITEIENFKFSFIKHKDLENNKYYINDSEIDKFYEYNEFANISGGRSNALQILKNVDKFKDYNKNRDYLTYNTTYLSAHNHFGTVSIREVYNAFKNNKDIINQLIWHNFYNNICYHFPHILNGQIGGENKAFKSKFDHIKWSNNKELFNKWCTGELGIPICDAAMRQLNKTGFMHGRVRMVCASVLTKLLLIPWQYGEKYFAQKLIDYDCIQNGCNWNWIAGGIDPQQVYRIFSPQLQGIKFDKNAEYIHKFIPELKDVIASDIHNWETSYIKYKHCSYPNPQIDYKQSRKHGLAEFGRINKLKL